MTPPKPRAKVPGRVPNWWLVVDRGGWPLAVYTNRHDAKEIVGRFDYMDPKQRPHRVVRVVAYVPEVPAKGGRRG